MCMYDNFGRCVNGGKGPNPNTYFLCDICSKAAPNAVAMGLVRVPQRCPPHKIRMFNANYLGLYVRCQKQ